MIYTGKDIRNAFFYNDESVWVEFNKLIEVIDELYNNVPFNEHIYSGKNGKKTVATYRKGVNAVKEKLIEIKEDKWII